jgi:N-dimethylarginine dimethylaminohydrolase
MTHESRHFYMCPPDHFAVDYAINAWTDPGDNVDVALAKAQWETLVNTYIDAGAKVTVLEPEPGVPELTFAGDSIFLYGDVALSSRFRHAERQPEVVPMARRFAKLGYRMEELPRSIHFEGNAEAISWNGMLLGGYGVRSDRAALLFLSELLDVDVQPFQLARPYYHLDVCVAPIDEQTALYYPGAFTFEGRSKLGRLFPRLIAVTEAEAQALACNSVSVNGTVVMSTRRAPRVAEALRALGKRVVELDVSEFQKAGGGAKCLTLEAYRSTAAPQRAVA